MKSKVVMPILALVLSTGAAFATQSKSFATPQSGYLQVVQNGEIHCELIKACSDDSNEPICRWGTLQLKGMDEFGACTEVVYENPQN